MPVGEAWKHKSFSGFCISAHTTKKGRKLLSYARNKPELDYPMIEGAEISGEIDRAWLDAAKTWRKELTNGICKLEGSK